MVEYKSMQNESCEFDTEKVFDKLEDNSIQYEPPVIKRVSIVNPVSGGFGYGKYRLLLVNIFGED